MEFWSAASVVLNLLLLAVSLPVAYLCLLALAAIPKPHARPGNRPRCRFALAIPAHDEEAVVGRTVAMLREADYPADLVDVIVVADHCTDRTAVIARAAGAIVYERDDGPRGSKGAALCWLFRRILDSDAYDAVVVFDADTRAAPDFLLIMNERLELGDSIIQGQHRIRNPEDGWFPALTWAMFLVDNRLQNQSRSNLGWSAKIMGDSICFRAEVLRRFGWGEGLADDYAFRARLLLAGFRIRYEPRAIGSGEAAPNWQSARWQRARWLRGARDVARRYAHGLLVKGMRGRDPALIDGALQAYFPSYSTLTVVVLALGLLQGGVASMGFGTFPAGWICLAAVLAIYPFWGLMLERAPFRAYLAILTGPVFIVWRSWLALLSRYGKQKVKWVRTPRKAP